MTSEAPSRDPSHLARLLATRTLSGARAVLDDRLEGAGATELARDLDSVIAHAAAGHSDDRLAMIAVTSWVASHLAPGDPTLARLAAAARDDNRPFAHATFSPARPRAALPPGGRLAEVGLAVFASLTGLPERRATTLADDDFRAIRAAITLSPAARRRAVLPLRERARRHHHPTFVGRLLDQPWIDRADVVRIAARRPTTDAIALAVAVRDRWFRHAEVRTTLLENPFTPAALTLALLVTAPDSTLRHVQAEGHESPELAEAARLFAGARHG